MLELDFMPYTLKLKHVFRISQGARDTTPLMFIKITYDGVTGYGEASMPALYGETPESARAFLSMVDLSAFNEPFDLERILNYVDGLAPGNAAVKASIDMALHDLVGKLLGVPVRTLFGLPAQDKATCMTIGIDTPENMAKRAQEFSEFHYLKIKLGTDQDHVMIQAIREVTDQPFFIDANQGWKDRQEALDTIHWLKEQGAIFIEQPMKNTSKRDNAWITERSPLPIIGDEGFQRLSDLKEASGIYHGINIKLMKSTGVREGFKMAVAAKALGMYVMIGCMTETSCAISAASQLMYLADWIDLDGNLDITNDPFQGVRVQNGVVIPSTAPGLGLTNDLDFHN